MDNLTKLNLFVSPLWIFDLNDDPNLREMVKQDGFSFSKQMIDENVSSADKDSQIHHFLEYPGYGTSELRKKVHECIEVIIKDNPAWGECEIFTRSRNNCYAPNESDTAHYHSGMTLVGVYYVSIPENSGNISFLDTRLAVTSAWVDPLVKDDKANNSPHAGTRTCRAFYEHIPKEGTLVFFPNYLVHSVGTNLSNEVRVSVVIDITLKRKNHREY